MFRRLPELHLTLFAQGKTANDRLRSHNFEVNRYEKKCASQPAFFNPHMIIDFVLCSVGLFSVLAGLNKSSPGNSAPLHFS